MTSKGSESMRILIEIVILDIIYRMLLDEEISPQVSYLLNNN